MTQEIKLSEVVAPHCVSRGDARRFVEQGSVRVNGVKITDWFATIPQDAEVKMRDKKLPVGQQ